MPKQIKLPTTPPDYDGLMLFCQMSLESESEEGGDRATGKIFGQLYKIVQHARDRRAAWTQTPPTEQGTYWHWNGDNDCAPLPMFVLWSGSDNKCFVSQGQLGISHAIMCEDYGGWWMPLFEPELPTA